MILAWASPFKYKVTIDVLKQGLQNFHMKQEQNMVDYFHLIHHNGYCANLGYVWIIKVILCVVRNLLFVGQFRGLITFFFYYKVPRP